jgi:acetate kinase
VAADPRCVLALNCGSSSVKFALLDPVTGTRLVTALGERVGTPDAAITLSRGDASTTSTPADPTHRGVVAHLLAALTADERGAIAGVGHRVVHGGPTLTDSVIVDAAVLATLAGVVDLAPLQVPGNIAGIEAAQAELPGVANVAVFDTGFHQTLPPVAYRYAVPSHWYTEHGIRRYGFHGISYRYVVARAAELLERPVTELAVVALHLGNGCSAAAVLDGESLDTSMGFTPLEGLVMGTRSGDVDPGALAHVGRRTSASVAELVDDLNHRSGLLGLSGLSNDMRTLVDAADAGSPDAALALDVFCYRLAKTIGALAVALGRLDAVVFTGGIGEHAVRVRSEVLARLGVLGISEDAAANAAHGRHTRGRISEQAGARAPGPTVLVVPTDEELVIARDTAALTASSR